MYDIHSHLIFGEDDGSKSLDESIEMVRAYKKMGYEGTIVTPHFDKGRYLVTSELIEKKLKIIEERLAEERIDFKLYPGNEIQIDFDTIDLIKSGKVFRLNNSSYVLCELPFASFPSFAKDLFYQMALEGWTPIIAHPERYTYTRENIPWLKDLIKSGALLQLNLSSLGSDSSKDLAIDLLESRMVSLIGTDTHQMTYRSPLLEEEMGLAREILGEDSLRELIYTNPLRVIEDRPIANPYENIRKEEPKKKKPWYKFWR
ncbi:MAG: protein tyrosine phosphatase [Anaerococcus sp.]|nr:protein tyrosine phosphatase [Anaerococcus sp.]